MVVCVSFIFYVIMLLKGNYKRCQYDHKINRVPTGSHIISGRDSLIILTLTEPTVVVVSNLILEKLNPQLFHLSPVSTNPHLFTDMVKFVMHNSCIIELNMGNKFTLRHEEAKTLVIIA